jgi:hypothetical protein
MPAFAPVERPLDWADTGSAWLFADEVCEGNPPVPGVDDVAEAPSEPPAVVVALLEVVEEEDVVVVDVGRGVLTTYALFELSHRAHVCGLDG